MRTKKSTLPLKTSQNKANKKQPLKKKVAQISPSNVEDDGVTDIYEVTVEDAVEVIVPPEKRKKKPKEREHYVNSKDFENQICEYYNTGVISHNLGDCINKIANGLSYAPNFINYSYKEDMIGDAVVKMFSALIKKSFKLNSGFSPFSYFTTIAFHAFINRIKKEKKHHKAITEYKEKVYNELMLDIEDESGAHIYVDPNLDDDYTDEE